MPTFIHISDIHFGQEKVPGDVHVNEDIKKCLIKDAATQLRELGRYPAAGILVTGDIAYSGLTEEYTAAGLWLDSLAAAIGCSKTAVHIVPGNHDIDRTKITLGVGQMLSEVAEKGERHLDVYLMDEALRGMIYGKFSAYVPFAEGYNCPLDQTGGLAGNKPYPLGDGRSLRFIGLNTAIGCNLRDKEGRLLVGKSQRVLNENHGEEIIVLAHHPMHWLQDGPDAMKFIRKRARVLITGHEHNPKVAVDAVSDRRDLLVMAAGATVPPSNETLHYTYNLIDFELEAESLDLLVSVHPRSWDDDEKEFDADFAPLNGQTLPFRLGCPNFRSAAAAQPEDVPCIDREPVPDSDQAEPEEPPMPPPPPTAEGLALLLLRFFRDLAPGQRLRVLSAIEAIPDDWSEDLAHAIERDVVDQFWAEGRSEELTAAIDQVLKNDENKKGEETQ